MIYYNGNDIVIRDLQQSDAKILTAEENAQGWNTDISKYEMLRDVQYLTSQNTRATSQAI